MTDKTWKGTERRIAELFIKRGFKNAHRNPLSGANNVTDLGKPRCGDVIGTPFHVEVKHSKSLFRRMLKEYKKMKYPTIFYDLKSDLIAMRFDHLVFNVDNPVPDIQNYRFLYLIHSGFIIAPFKFQKCIYDWMDKAISESNEKPVLLILHPKNHRKFFVIVKRSMIGWCVL